MKKLVFETLFSNQKGSVVKIPVAVYGLGLTPIEFYVYGLITYFKMTYKKWPSAVNLAGPDSQLSHRAIQEVTRRLEQKGAIRRYI